MNMTIHKTLILSVLTAGAVCVPAFADYGQGVSPSFQLVAPCRSSADSGEPHVTINPADANHDGHVTISDFTPIAVNFMRTGMTWEDGDYNCDGTVNISDFAQLSVNFLQGILDILPPAGTAIQGPAATHGDSETVKNETPPVLPCTSVAIVLMAMTGLAAAFLTAPRKRR